MGFLKLVVAALLVSGASAFAPPLSVRSQSMAVKMMADEKKPEPPKPKVRAPGEGDPFSAAAKAAAPPAAKQLRTISDATQVDRFQGSNYIETEEEPWLATSRTKIVPGISTLS